LMIERVYKKNAYHSVIVDRVAFMLDKEIVVAER